ncbi:MAG: helix-turn-helix transcriptional regulator [Erysipelotrichaceae bacterium]|nr:helix-turn-helix transcriptional regulator [Erysipelotrichaceae bacterium]
MAAKKVGTLIKEARTNAGLTQEALAKKVDGVSASDISKTERGEKDLTQEQLKQIAKATGVTQKSLLEAPKNLKTTTSKTSSAKTSGTKTSSTKTSSTKTSSTKTSTGTSSKTSSTSSGSKTSSSGTSVKVTATEKKLLELYRAADSDTKKAAMSILKGEQPEGSDILSSLLQSAVGKL